MEEAITKALINAGVGGLLAVLVLVGLYRIVQSLGEKFIEAQRGQAEALGRQAQSLEGLSTALQDFTGRDNTEHREMLVLLRFIAREQNDFDEVRREHNTRKKQTHPQCPA